MSRRLLGAEFLGGELLGGGKAAASKSLEQARRFSFAGAKVQIYQALDGRLSFYYGHTRLEQEVKQGTPLLAYVDQDFNHSTTQVM